MAEQDRAGQPGAPSERLIGGMFAVDAARPLLGAGGGLIACAVDRRGAGPQAVAVQARPDAPARLQAINALAGAVIPALMTPLGAGVARDSDGRDALFVVCAAPPGPSLATMLAESARPWSEQELLQSLLRPAAQALAALAALPVTHRAIRLDNLFRGGPGEPVTLGCAWASPPGLLQPAIYEPPYAAMCLPSARGEGSIADDVYALGVAMLTLATGKVPLAGLDEAEIVRRKLDLGSFKALLGQERLSPIIADLVGGMLAEDPDHRPPPRLLADPIAARARRVAARPPRRAQRPLEVGGQTAWHARSLAHALTCEADGGARLLRSGTVDGWLRRGLGEAALAARIEEAVRQRQTDSPGEDARADAMLAMRAVVALDPLAPLSWEGVALWPDGLGPLLASLPAEQMEPRAGDFAGKLASLLSAEAAIGWGALRADRCDIATLGQDMRRHRAVLRMGGWAGGLARLRYALNPLLACRSRLVGGAFVLRLADLLPALEAAARPERHGELPVDREIAAFVAARDEQRSEAALIGLGGGRTDAAALAALRLLASLQQRLGARPTPRIAAWLAHHVENAAAVWRNRARRDHAAAELAGIVAAGQLDAMVALLDDDAAHASDEAGAQAAADAMRDIDFALAALAARAAGRGDTARRIGGEVASCIGLAALGAMAIAALAG